MHMSILISTESMKIPSYFNMMYKIFIKSQLGNYWDKNTSKKMEIPCKT